ncbi:MAG TPA: wax ester/triacylglycerol synthase family O-acyltransferase [Actinomycetota bacterium]
MPAERLSSLDASFLYLETPAMHMHVAGLSIFAPREDGPLTYDDVQRVVEARIHLAPRLRQRVLPVPGNLGRPLWVDDDRFDLDFHLRRSAVPSPGGGFQLERAVGRVLSRPLDRSKPLWELYVFEGVDEGRTAVLLKLHHALADGIGGMLIGSALFDLEPNVPLGPPPRARWIPEPIPPREELVRAAVDEMASHPAEALARTARAPQRAIDSVVRTMSGALALVGMGPAPPGPFDGPTGPARRFAIAAVPFERLRTVKHTLGGTINDVVLATVAIGLHKLLASRGESTKGRSLRVMVPVSVRSKAEAGDVGNRVAPAFVEIPIGHMSPRSRLAKVRTATEELKSSSMAVSADAIIGLGAFAPPALHAMAARVVSRGRWFNLVVSNIPAPQMPLYLAGARLVANHPAMPLGEHGGLSIACTSLGGTMAFGLTADWDTLKDIDVLARGIEHGIDDLAVAAAKKAAGAR